MKKNNKNIYLISFFCLISALGLLIYTSFTENNVYFLNVSEFLSLNQEKNSGTRLFGIVAEQEIEKIDDNKIKFYLLDQNNKVDQILITYTGTIPETFKSGAEVIVEGKMIKNQFEATMLMTKCPSKYEKENRTENKS